MKARMNKGNLPLRLAAALACLVLATTTMLSGLYAKFATRTSAQEEARVAAFAITEGLGDLVKNINVELAPGENLAYPISIQNNAEVSVAYTLEVVRETENIPLTVTLTGTGSTIADTTATGTLAPGDGEGRNVTLNITWPAGENEHTLSHEIDLITVKLTAEQID